MHDCFERILQERRWTKEIEDGKESEVSSDLSILFLKETGRGTPSQHCSPSQHRGCQGSHGCQCKVFDMMQLGLEPSFADLIGRALTNPTATRLKICYIYCYLAKTHSDYEFHIHRITFSAEVAPLVVR